ncbi:hypothetical protein Cni_G03042 [Canna indica]|uniref:sucrose synthase n=1 Tax=Canna indica TaxID=4628 RepID=A0AAQ3JTS5_9LILI|nr:hypothetical protein Cni_G03042 [Canna indica]
MQSSCASLATSLTTDHSVDLGKPQARIHGHAQYAAYISSSDNNNSSSDEHVNQDARMGKAMTPDHAMPISKTISSSSDSSSSDEEHVHQDEKPVHEDVEPVHQEAKLVHEDVEHVHQDNASLASIQEAIVIPPRVALAIRPRPGVWEYVRVNISELVVEELTVPEYLHFKEKRVEGRVGFRALQRFIPSSLAVEIHWKWSAVPQPTPFVQVVPRQRKHSMMLNDKIQSLSALQAALRKAEQHLLSIPSDTPYSEFNHRFQELGLEKGWGDTTQRVYENIHLLLDLLEAPDPCTLEIFLGIIPMMLTVMILSPHGYFAQANVLGYLDTGGLFIEDVAIKMVDVASTAAMDCTSKLSTGYRMVCRR